MNIAFRVDASTEIGSGHVMRCLTLAKKLAKNFHNIFFICRKAEGSMNEMIQKNHFKLIELEKVNGSLWDWTTVNWKEDASETLNKIESLQIDLIVVDHYAIDEKWEKVIYKHVKKIIVIDDLANRVHACDILLDQNYYIDMNERYKALVPSKTTTCLGPNYSLLRDEFFKTYSKNKTNTIFVFFGAADLTNETLKTINALKEIQPVFQFNMIVVTGKINPHKEIIEKKCAKLDYCEYFCQVNNMAELMAKCTLSITAGGTITWEKAMVDLPGIVISVADNQVELSTALALKNCIKYLGDGASVDEGVVKEAVIDLLGNPLKMEQLIQNMKQVLNKKLVRENSLIKVIEAVK